MGSCDSWRRRARRRLPRSTGERVKLGSLTRRQTDTIVIVVMPLAREKRH